MLANTWYEASCFLLCYPEESVAARAASLTAILTAISHMGTAWGCGGANGAAYWCREWSAKLDTKVVCIPEGVLFRVLKVNGQYAEVLCSEIGHGWIYVPEKLEHRAVNIIREDEP